MMVTLMVMMVTIFRNFRFFLVIFRAISVRARTTFLKKIGCRGFLGAAALFLCSGRPGDNFTRVSPKLIFYTSDTPLCTDEKAFARVCPKITRAVPGDVWCRAHPRSIPNFFYGIGLVKKFFWGISKNRDHHMTIMMVTPNKFVEK
jgi:hypothetical protein